MRRLSLLIAVGSLLAACQPVCDDAVLGKIGGECAPQVRAKYLKDGINLKVTHARYQFMPDLDEMFATCRASIHYYAEKSAEVKHKQIQPIDDSKITMTYDRDHSSGVSSCTATYPVAYKQ